MALFDKMKKQQEIRKKAEWKQGLIHTIIELNDTHMKLITPTETDIVFYKDIMDVQQVSKVVNIRTIAKKYSLISRKGADKAQELQMQLLEYMIENK